MLSNDDSVIVHNIAIFSKYIKIQMCHIFRTWGIITIGHAEKLITSGKWVL